MTLQDFSADKARRISSGSVDSQPAHQESGGSGVFITTPVKRTPIKRMGGSGGKRGRGSLRSNRSEDFSHREEVPEIRKVCGCAHFHYETVELGPIEVSLVMPSPDRLNRCYGEREFYFTVRVSSNRQNWLIYRCYTDVVEFDKQLHRCVYDRRFSRLTEFPDPDEIQGEFFDEDLLQFMRSYFKRFSDVAGSLISCYPVLKWLELDNRGYRLLPAEETPINTPAVAAAYAVKDYVAQAPDELTLKVGDIISVIDMPPPTESMWWKGKLTIVLSPRPDRVKPSRSDSEEITPPRRGQFFGDSPPSLNLNNAAGGFEVGFFPSHCVQTFGSQMKVVPQVFVKGGSVKGKESPDLGAAAASTAAVKPVFQRRGKLMTFLRGFLSSRPSRRHLKEAGILQERVFGCDLGEHLQNTGEDVPVILKSCTGFVEKYGLVDGVYRLSGVMSNIQRLRLGFDENRPVNLEEKSTLHDIHSVGSLLKMYFRELPNPLFTYQLYGKFVEAIEQGQDKNQRILRLHEVVRQLPPPHYRTAEFLVRHLCRIGDLGNKTGMHHQNLAIVWAPNLFRCHDLEVSARDSTGAILKSVNIQAVILEYLIRYAEIIFSQKLPAWRSQSAQVGPTGYPSRRRQRPHSMTSPMGSPTPSKLIDLGEAQRKLLAARQEKIPPGSGLPDLTNRKCIDVNGGPANLPGKYHTIINIPSRSHPELRPSGSYEWFPGGHEHNKATAGDGACPVASGSGGVEQRNIPPAVAGERRIPEDWPRMRTESSTTEARETSSSREATPMVTSSTGTSSDSSSTPPPLPVRYYQQQHHYHPQRNPPGLIFGNPTAMENSFTQITIPEEDQEDSPGTFQKLRDSFSQVGGAEGLESLSCRLELFMSGFKRALPENRLE